MPDDSFPGLVRGDRLLVAPCHRWDWDDLYVLSLPDAPLGVWRCQSYGPKVGIGCWKDDRRDETLRTLSLAEFEAAVVAKIAAWLHVHSEHRLREGAL